MERVLLTLACLSLAASLGRGEQGMVLRLDFDSPEQSGMMVGEVGRLAAGYQGSQSLLIEKPERTGSAVRWLDLPADKVAGRIVTFSAVVRAEDISEKPQHYNGIKVMLVLDFDGHKEYPQINFATGSFDWTPGQQTLRIPAAVTGARLVLGLEEVSGRVWFDEVEVRVGRPQSGGRRSETMFKGHNLARLRGAMHRPVSNEEDIRVLAREWGANHVRWQINWVPMTEAEQWARDLAAYDRWLDSLLPEIDKGVDLCEKYGLLVLLDLHTPPGGRIEGGVCPLFTDRQCQDKLVEVWQRLARRYKGRACIWAYDLLNEPVEPPAGQGTVTWPELFARVTHAIREIEPGKPVVFEPSPWGNPEGFDSITPLDLDGVIYSFHMYLPHQFTHQSLYGNPSGISYPGQVEGRYWDKEALREAMRPAIDFQKEFNVQIYVGEFSAIRWAPGESAYNYLRDCIELFEEYGWDWAYHAYREWDGWSVEHGPDPGDHTPTAAPTRRKQLLSDWFAKNQKPG